MNFGGKKFSVWFLVFLFLFSVPRADAGWKTKALGVTGAWMAQRVVTGCIKKPSCNQKALDKLVAFVNKHPEIRGRVIQAVERSAETRYRGVLRSSRETRKKYNNILDAIRGSSFNKSYSIAKNGGRHGGQLRQFEKQSPAQLQKTIVSFEKQISKHEQWIRNPRIKVKGFDDLIPEHRSSLIHHWRQDVSRHKELKYIAQQVLKRKIK